MMALFLLVTRPVGHQMLFKVIHEWQVAKDMGWGMLIVERGIQGSPPRKFYNSGGPWMQFNVLLDHWFYNHKE